MSKPRKVWLKAECWVTEAMLEVAQSAFIEAAAIGLEIDDGLGPEKQKRYPEGQVLVKAYFESLDAEKDDISESVTRFFYECGFDNPHIDFMDFVEEDWQGNFIKTCTTFRVDPDIYIVPSFEIEEFNQRSLDKLYIEMDPENAFGTGQHQTTKLCLMNVRKLLKESEPKLAFMNGLDVGTGSGILAILMKKLGIGSVLATEVDDDALVTAKKNMAKNGVELMTLLVNEQHQYDQQCYDLVVANILAPVLIAMADNLSSCLRARGKLILSGILVEQAAQVIDAFQSRALTLAHQDTMDDWCALVFIKPANSGI